MTEFEHECLRRFLVEMGLTETEENIKFINTIGFKKLSIYKRIEWEVNYENFISELKKACNEHIITKLLYKIMDMILKLDGNIQTHSKKEIPNSKVRSVQKD